MRKSSSVSVAIRYGLDGLVDLWRNPLPVARVAINRRPVRAPWGGGNQWLDQIVRTLREHGYSVQFHLDRPVDCILLIDPRNGPTVTFDAAAVAKYKAQHPHVPCIHRVNDNDKHRDSDFRDTLQATGNAVADHTVFVSEWLRDYEAQRWFDLRRPHSVIVNGANPRVFHPSRGAQLERGAPLRLVTHHWSTNWNKGFATYVEIDRLIAEGRLPDTELWVIGRWPSEIRWRTARTFSPKRGAALAELLRQCHVYVTASQWESGPMHHIEAIQCGLPVIYHVNGGGIVEVARRFGVALDGDIVAVVSHARARYAELREILLRDAPSGERMCAQYRTLIQGVIDVGCGRGTSSSRAQSAAAADVPSDEGVKAPQEQSARRMSRGLLSSKLGIALYLLLPNNWVWACLSENERSGITAGNKYHNTHRRDYANPTEYQGGVGFDSLMDPRRERHREWLVAFLNRVKPASVLEVGPGSGYLTRTIVEHPAVRRYVAVDINPVFLEYLRPRLERVDKPGFMFDLVSGTVGDVSGGQFDAAVLLSVVHHIPDRERLFTALAARLKRPGDVLAIDPTHYLLQIRKIARKILRRGYLTSRLELARGQQLSTHAMCQLAEYRAVARRTGFEIRSVEFADQPARVRRWRRQGIPLGPFWRWSAQEMMIEMRVPTMIHPPGQPHGD